MLWKRSSVGRASSLDRSSPDTASPPAKRQQTTSPAGGPSTTGTRRASLGGDVARRGLADQQPTKWTQTELPDPSTLPMLIELNDRSTDDSQLNAYGERSLQDVLGFGIVL